MIRQRHHSMQQHRPRKSHIAFSALGIVLLWQSIWFSRQYIISIQNTQDPMPTMVSLTPLSSNPLKPRAKLRFDWTRLDLSENSNSHLVQRINDHQRNCSLPLANFRYRNRFGLGSDLHLWGQAVCNALENGSFRVRTMFPWIWMDESQCQDSLLSPMLCYFPQSETICDRDRSILHSPEQALLVRNITRGRGRISNECSSLIRSVGGVDKMWTATTSWLFSRVSPLVQREAQSQVLKVFPRGVIPDNLVTVHIRWGDKGEEMKLASIEDYMAGVMDVLRRRTKSSNSSLSEEVHIYLATEDPKAVDEFKRRAPPNWNVYVDAYLQEMLPHRRSEYNGNPQMSRDLGGRPGLVALASLLVAMEADDFVLTTASNWSRLMNELRKGILDPRCGNCTLMIDLIPER